MVRSLFSFSGEIGRSPYALLTLTFCAATVGLATAHGDGGFTELLTSPWETLGRGLDQGVQIEPWPVDIAVSLAVAVPVVWLIMAMTVRRLRALGQSPWWSVLMLSGTAAPLMLVLSFVPARVRAASAG